jgi:hypothetical protein
MSSKAYFFHSAVPETEVVIDPQLRHAFYMIQQRREEVQLENYIPGTTF